jgi:serine/threonine-protein kinase
MSTTTLVPPAPAAEASQADRLRQILLTLSKAYLQRQQYAEAYAKLKELLQLDGENPEIVLDAAVAALGANDASEEALALYEKAWKHHSGVDALWRGLPTLFVTHNISTPFAIDLCAKAAEASPENERQIRLHLKKYYETAGLLDRALAEEQKAIFTSRDPKAVRDYFEKLWWEGKFSAAHTTLNNAPRTNGRTTPFLRERALTHAYEHFASATGLDGIEAIQLMLPALANLVPPESFQDFSDYLLLRSMLPEGDLSSRLKHTEPGATPIPFDQAPLSAIFRSADKSSMSNKIIASPFDLRREVADLLKKPVEWREGVEPDRLDCEGMLCVHLINREGLEAPDKVLHLLNAHLLRLPEALLRVTGTTLVSLAKDPMQQARAMIDFMQSLEDYNAVASERERFRLLGSLLLTRPLSNCDHRTVLNALIDATHLLRYAQSSAAAESGAGTLLVMAEEEKLLQLKAKGVNLIFMERISLMPGRHTICAELIWRNPLAQLKDGQVYQLGRFAVQKLLLKHNGYGTYLATDAELDRPTAMKIVCTQDSTLFQHKDGLRGAIFERIRAIGKLSHPHLAYIFDLGDRDGLLYVAREFVDGKNLSEVTFHDEHRDGEVLVLLQKIVRALMYAKSKGVVHLGLKPSNIWLSDAQDLKITDFWIPGLSEDVTTADVLTPAHWRYAAPEILMGENGDTRSDVYSIGIIAYELIAGWHPYATAKNIQSPRDIMKARIVALSEIERPHHKSWDDFVMKAIQRHAERRYQDLSEMDNDLRNIQMEMLQRDLNGGK